MSQKYVVGGPDWRSGSTLVNATPLNAIKSSTTSLFDSEKPRRPKGVQMEQLELVPYLLYEKEEKRDSVDQVQSTREAERGRWG